MEDQLEDLEFMYVYGDQWAEYINCAVKSLKRMKNIGTIVWMDHMGVPR
jgi:hypothetical protein